MGHNQRGTQAPGCRFQRATAATLLIGAVPVTHDAAARIHSRSSRPEPPQTRATRWSDAAEHRPSPLARPLLLDLYEPAQVGDREGGKLQQSAHCKQPGQELAGI